MEKFSNSIKNRSAIIFSVALLLYAITTFATYFEQDDSKPWLLDHIRNTHNINIENPNNQTAKWLLDELGINPELLLRIDDPDITTIEMKDEENIITIKHNGDIMLRRGDEVLHDVDMQYIFRHRNTIFKNNPSHITIRSHSSESDCNIDISNTIENGKIVESAGTIGAGDAFSMASLNGNSYDLISMQQSKFDECINLLGVEFPQDENYQATDINSSAEM